MSCDWGQENRYVPLRDRFKPGQEYEVNGEKVTVYEVDLERMTCIVRPHSNPVNLFAIEMEELE